MLAYTARIIRTTRSPIPCSYQSMVRSKGVVIMIDIIELKIKGWFNVYLDGINIGRLCKYKSGVITFEGLDITTLKQILAKMKELQNEVKK
jgi:hypothetical protein